jgi:hypothetical protein
MDVLGTLPVWAQLLIAFLVAGLLVVMNLGWLIQARGWLEQQRRRPPAGEATPRTGPATPPARSEHDRA